MATMLARLPMALLGLLAPATAAPQCPFECVPGLSKVGVGVDLAFFTPRVQEQVVPQKMLKQRVVNMTTAAGNVWTNPFVNKTYGVWDQVSELFVNSRSTSDAFRFDFSNDFDFQEQFSESVDGGALFGLISASEEMSEMFNLVTKVGATMVVRSGEVDTYTAELYPTSDLAPSSIFLESVGGIPALWFAPSTWASKVLPHIQQFGTHHINTISAGGEFRYEAIVESAYLSAHGDVDMDTQADADFLFFFSADAEAHTSASASETFRQSLSMRHVVCNGGNGKCDANSTAVYDAWVDSVHLTPWVLNARYTPNYDLVPDLKLRAVTEAYLAWQGLTRLMERLSALRARIADYMSLPDPVCQITTPTAACSVGTPAQGICYVSGASGDPATLIPLARANAKELLAHTDPLHVAFQAALSTQNTTMAVESWLPNATAWVKAVRELGEIVFSRPTKLECTAYGDMSQDPVCKIFGCSSHVCQDHAGATCGDCQAKRALACSWSSGFIPQKLLAPLPLSGSAGDDVRTTFV